MQARQLATHDELAAQLKIAQSNLTLAETHTDYLEETLRRRGSVATTIGRRLSNSSTLHGLGMGASVDGLPAPPTQDSAASKVTAFFRPKLARKNTAGTAATGRSSSASPSMGAPGSPEPRTSSSSSDLPEWTQLEARNASLEAANAALGHEREELAKKCAGLEKTKDDLLVELEGVTAELFQEANMMVADEKKKTARFQEEAAALREEVGRLHEELAAARAQQQQQQQAANGTPVLIQTSPRNIRNLTISPAPPSPPSSPPRQPIPGASSAASMLRSESLDPASAARSPLTVDTNGLSPGSPQPPASPAESAASATRKWFNFGRGASAASPVPGEGEGAGRDAPAMDRGDSVQSNATTSSLASIANSLFRGGGADREAKPDQAEAEAETTVTTGPGVALSPGLPEPEPIPVPTPPTAVPEPHKDKFPRARSRSRSPPPRSPRSPRERPPPVPILPPGSPSPPPPAPPLPRPFQPRTFSLGSSVSRTYPPLPPSSAVAHSSGPLSPPPVRSPVYSSPLPSHAFDRTASSGAASAASASASAAGARGSPRLVVQMPASPPVLSPQTGGVGASQPPTPGLNVPPSPLSGPGSRPPSRAGSVKAMDDLDSLMDSIQGMTDDLFGGHGGEDETEELELPAGSGRTPDRAARSRPSGVRHGEPVSSTDGDEDDDPDLDADEDLEGAEVVAGTRVAEGARRGSTESTGGLPYDQ